MMKSNSLPRSQRLRQKRSSGRSTTPARQKRTKSGSSHNVPVLVRGDVPLDTMVTPRRRSRARRRFDIALNVPGAEMRLPSLPAVRLGWRVVSFMLTALLCMAIYVLWSSPIYQVQDLQIEGLQRLTAREINTLLNINGEHIFAIDQAKLYAQLQDTFPELSSIDIKVSLPAAVKLTVTERTPVLVWYQNGRTLWVDQDGYAFPAREADPPELKINAAGDPKVFLGPDPDPNQLLTPDFVKAILEVRDIAPGGHDLVYSVDHGLGWKEKKGWTVYLGLNLNDIDMKLQVYKAIEKYLKKAKLKPALVSVESVHAPYYRMEP
jgi:hypothetical protein